MYRHSYIKVLFTLLLVVLVGLHYQYGMPWYAYFILLLLFGLVLFPGVYFIQLNYFVQSLYKGPSNKKQIAITFDDGPMREFTPKVLDILKNENVRASFFLIGKNIAGNEDILKRLVNEGHTIGNHSFEHGFWFSMQGKQKMIADAGKCDEIIEQVTGLQPKLFRPPYGVTNPMVAQVIKQKGYTSIGWSVRTYDTNAQSAEQLLVKALKNLESGDIVLFHDWAAHTIGILSEFIQEAKRRGFELVTVDELLQIPAYKNR